MRTARSTTSGENFGDFLMMAPFSNEGASSIPGAVHFVTLGLLAGVPVSIAHTESDDEIRVISFRKATSREARLFFDQVQD
jgi:hypothetical protein